MKNFFSSKYLILTLLITINICFAFQYRKETLSFIAPDETNTKLIINEYGIEFLRSITGPIAILATGGKAKTGKSYMNNNIHGWNHTEGFHVGTGFKPGTKGLNFWAEPHNITINGQKVTLLIMDTEGLGAPGSPVDSYDAKICALSVILSSYYLYNLKQQIAMQDINMLHTVSIVSNVYEKKYNSSFSWPPMTIVVQNWEHDLGDETPEQYLDWVLQEKNNKDNTEEIRKYNETVRVVKKFPKVGQPPIYFLPHPNRQYEMKDLPKLKFTELAPEYKRNLLDLKRKIMSSMQIKSHAGHMLTSEDLVDFTQKLVQNFNSEDFGSAADVWQRRYLEGIKNQTFEYYKEQMNVSLPENENLLHGLHEKTFEKCIMDFKSKCSGDSFENEEILTRLKEVISLYFHDLTRNNTDHTLIMCQGYLNAKLKEIDSKKFSTILEFDETVKSLKNDYFLEMKGDKVVIDNTFEQFKKTLAYKKDVVLVENEKGDYVKMLMGSLIVYFVLYVFAVSTGNNTLSMLSGLSIVFLFVISASFFKLFPEYLFWLPSFRTCQFFVNGIVEFFQSFNAIVLVTLQFVATWIYENFLPLCQQGYEAMLPYLPDAIRTSLSKFDVYFEQFGGIVVGALLVMLFGFLVLFPAIKRMFGFMCCCCKKTPKTLDVVKLN